MRGRDELCRALDGSAARDELSLLYGGEETVSQARRYQRLVRAAAGLLESIGQDDGAASGLRLFSSPGRTELGGNHTDHNRGCVLAAALSLDSIACVAPLAGRRVRIASEGWDKPFELDLSSLEPVKEEVGRTEALIRGVARGLADRGKRIGGFAGAMASSVPVGSGLSSSASVEILFGSILSGLYGAGLEWRELAEIGRFAENRFFGKPCGLMDQMACAAGGIQAMDFADASRPRVRRVERNLDAEDWVLCVVDTGGSHAGLGADYAAIPAEMKAVAAEFGLDDLRGLHADRLFGRTAELRAKLGDRAILRAYHFIEENDRAVLMARTLENGDFDAYLELVKKSGSSSWRFLQNVTPPGDGREQGLALALTLGKRLLGKDVVARVHGGGFAGTIQAYARRRSFERYRSGMEAVFGPGSVIRLRIRPVGAREILAPD